jgi:hypothetical protein
VLVGKTTQLLPTMVGSCQCSTTREKVSNTASDAMPLGLLHCMGVQPGVIKDFKAQAGDPIDARESECPCSCLTNTAQIEWCGPCCCC